jgi:RimJ/RimL family protein N-acetyltransferase
MYTFETNRLRLRPFTPDDWQDLYEYLSLDEVNTFLDEWECTKEVCKEMSVQRSTDETIWAVCLKETGKMIGHVDIRPEYAPHLCIYEIGYIFSPKYGKKGYATESLQRVIQHGFEDLNAHRIIADSYPEHTASWKLLERLKMRREAHFVKYIPFRTTADNRIIWNDVYRYAILQSEWALP